MIAKLSRTRTLAAAALTFAVLVLGGCPAVTSGPAAPSSEWADLTDFIAEFLRSALAASAL